MGRLRVRTAVPMLGNGSNRWAEEIVAANADCLPRSVSATGSRHTFAERAKPGELATLPGQAGLREWRRRPSTGNCESEIRKPAALSRLGEPAAASSRTQEQVLLVRRLEQPASAGPNATSLGNSVQRS